jgi:hypothetical protein
MRGGRKVVGGGALFAEFGFFLNPQNKWGAITPHDRVPIAESFRLGPGVTNGIKDFTIVANSGAEVGQTVTYKFDGKVYRGK